VDPTSRESLAELNCNVVKISSEDDTICETRFKLNGS
jgi:hypothetical protein